MIPSIDDVVKAWTELHARVAMLEEENARLRANLEVIAGEGPEIITDEVVREWSISHAVEVIVSDVKRASAALRGDRVQILADDLSTRDE